MTNGRVAEVALCQVVSFQYCKRNEKCRASNAKELDDVS